METMLMYGSGSQDWQNDQKMFIAAPSAEATSQASSQYYPFSPLSGQVLGTGKQISNETSETPPPSNIVHGQYGHASYQNDFYSRHQEQNYMIQNPSHMMVAPIPGSYSSTPSSQDDSMHYGAINHRRPQQNVYTNQSSNVSSPQMITPSINSYGHLSGVNSGPALHQPYHAAPEPSQQQPQQQHQHQQQQLVQQQSHQLGHSRHAYPSTQNQNLGDYYQSSYMYGENGPSHYSTFNQPDHASQLSTNPQSNISHMPIDGSAFKADVYTAPALAQPGDVNERILGVKADKEFVASSAKPHINYHAGENGNQDIRQASSSTQEPLDFNGRRLRKWKNRRYQCSHCDLSFYDEDLDEYARHVEEVERLQGTAATRRKYKCAEPSCPWHKIGFFRKLEARKHYSRKHGIPEFECRFWAGENKEKFPGCGVCTSRWHADSGNRIRHEQAIHKVPKIEKKRSTSPNTE